jgi:S1-C subfamily serine protease
VDRARSSLPHLARACLTAALAAGLALAVPARPAWSDEPTPTARAITLTQPGVVVVLTSVSVSVRLTFMSASQVSGKDNIDAHYTLKYSSGTGMVVTPDGTIVTASHVIEPEKKDIWTYATNQLFFKKLRSIFGSLSKDADPFQRYTLNDSTADQLLQQCYDGVTCEFNTSRSVSVLAPRQDVGASAPKPMPARVLSSTGFEDTDVAVLKVPGAGMPTVPLATSTGDLQSGQPITVLGFPGSVRSLPTGTTDPAKLFGHVSNVRPAGASQLVEVDIRLERGTSGGPVVDDNGKVIGLVSFSRLDSNGSRDQGYLRTVDDIRSALRGVGIQATRGEVDSIFAQAMEMLWARHYSAAIPLFQKVLNLYDGHLLAKRYLAEAQVKAGGPKDVPLPTATPKRSSALPTPVLLVIVAGMVAALAAAMLLIVRRRHRRQRGHGELVQAAWNAEPRDLGPIEADDPSLEGELSPVGGRPLDVADGSYQPPPAPANASQLGGGAGALADGSAAPTGAAILSAARGSVTDGGEVPAARRFCSNCGARLAGTPFCGNCGQRQ